MKNMVGIKKNVNKTDGWPPVYTTNAHVYMFDPISKITTQIGVNFISVANGKANFGRVCHCGCECGLGNDLEIPTI